MRGGGETARASERAGWHRARDLAPRDPRGLVDDLGTWLTTELDRQGAWDAPRGTVTPAADSLVASVENYRGHLVLVSPEVGLAVIPETRSGRLFRDEIGTLNARIAAVCDRVVLVVAGLPLILKDTAAQPEGTM